MWEAWAVPVDGPQVGRWLDREPRTPLSASTYAPAGFARYARVLHPATVLGRPTRWADVAQEVGATITAASHWSDVERAAGLAAPADAPRIGPPDLGVLPPETLALLVDVLADHTATPEACCFAFWAGWAHLRGGPAVAPLGASSPQVRTLTAEERDAPTLHLPGREYHVVRGALRSAVATARDDGADAGWYRSPSLIWPQDRQWCISTEVDLDSTVVGGTESAVGDVVGCGGLEGFEVGPEQQIAAYA
ncbi:hypothetical protein [Cellulomonas chitinilytica]|uniref:hypothetical protein n=1 Tax=Cellulomonas chitinilytica TaxID=398759 RepID=UPI001940F419|nr:hypothetical protein [Cellulomonas chitinilytica]